MTLLKEAILGNEEFPVLYSSDEGILTWSLPDDEHTYTTVYIERATSLNGTFAEIGSQSVADNTFFDVSGSKSDWYRIRFYDPVNLAYSDYSNRVKRNASSGGYLTVSDVRKILKVNSVEYDDNALSKVILMASERVDSETGRTWKGMQEVKNECYDGDDSQTVILNKSDIQTLDYLLLRESGNSAYTVVTPAYVHVYTEGMLRLDSDAYGGVEVETFPKGFKTVMVSYTYGNEKPTSEVKHLALLFVQQILKYKEDRETQIRALVKKLRYTRPAIV